MPPKRAAQSSTFSRHQELDTEPLDLQFGGRLEQLEVRWETWGELDDKRSNAILLCPAFSADSHASSHRQDPVPGWWEGMIGPGKALDTERYCVICPSLLGGTRGTTGPLSINPLTGQAYAGTFPVISVRDIVAVHLRLLDRLGIDQLAATIGGSLGAMEVLELVVRNPGRARHAIAISGTDATRPFTAAVRHLGRRAIQLDKAYQNGDYGDRPPYKGMALAREIGTLFYRSRTEFNQRFDQRPTHPPSRDGISFDVESYLEYQGEKGAAQFDPNSYLTLSLAMDLHDIWSDSADRGQMLKAVDTRFLIVGAKEDRLIPIDEQLEVHQLLENAGIASEFIGFSSPIGHDAFLVDIEYMNEIVGEYLDREDRPASEATARSD